jgi:hypothetical protein
MIILITYRDKKSGLDIVSNGYDVNTDQIVILPQQPLTSFDVFYNSEMGEWVLK